MQQYESILQVKRENWQVKENLKIQINCFFVIDSYSEITIYVREYNLFRESHNRPQIDKTEIPISNKTGISSRNRLEIFFNC